jgi:Domain of unknown function (DUF6901)
MKERENIVFKFKFSFQNGTSQDFTITLDGRTLKLIAPPVSSPPMWTQLEYNKCPNCPLDSLKHPHCPIALNLVDIVDYFKDLVSYEKTYLTIETGQRTFIGKVSLQEAIKSLVGIYMVTSGCPVMDHLRPMMQNYVPFPTMDESVYRLISMYVMAQLIRFRSGKRADWDLEKLLSICNDVQIINRSFFKRLRALKLKDASLNALVALDSIAAYTASFLEENNFGEFKAMFAPYLEEDNKNK